MDVSFTFPKNINEEQRGDFLAALDNPEVIDDGRRSFGLDWIIVFAVLKGAAQTASGAVAVISLAEKLVAWRSKMRREGQPYGVRVKVPGKAEVDLQRMDDDEIRRALGG